MAERQFEYCCAAFAGQATHLHWQFEPDTETDSWNINGCCGGECHVVTDMRFCPYCGTRLVNPLVPASM